LLLLQKRRLGVGQSLELVGGDFPSNLANQAPPEKIMDAIGLKPGMIIGEVAAGWGRFTLHLARRGDKGLVYAIDIAKSVFGILLQRIKKDGLNNSEIILGQLHDPCFPLTCPPHIAPGGVMRFSWMKVVCAPDLGPFRMRLFAKMTRTPFLAHSVSNFLNKQAHF
jgi:hypothetical protein